MFQRLRAGRFDREFSTICQGRASLLSILSSPQRCYRSNQEHKRRSASAELSSEGITLCATNFSAAHKEFMKCAIKTRKLKLGSTQKTKKCNIQLMVSDLNCVTTWTSFYAINFPFIRNFIGAKFDNTCILTIQVFVCYFNRILI